MYTLIISLIGILVGLSLGLSCYYAGYIVVENKNANYIQTTAIIINRKIVESKHDGRVSFKHIVNIAFIPKNTVVNTTQTHYITVYTNEQPYFGEAYLINSTIDIYYNVCPLKPIQQKYIDSCAKTTDGDAVRLTKYSTFNFKLGIAFGFIFVIIFGIILFKTIYKKIKQVYRKIKTFFIMKQIVTDLPIVDQIPNNDPPPPYSVYVKIRG